MHDNDETIFRYLNPTDNDMISELKKRDLEEVLVWLDRYYLEYRDIIGVSDSYTFGIELELEHFKGKVCDFWPFQLKLNEIVGNRDWEVRNDITLKWGREIVSEILSDSYTTWKKIQNMCEFVSKYGEIDIRCSSHVHVGSQILGDNPKYWLRLFKLWSIYENVIYRFSYGEYLTHRRDIGSYAMPSALYFDNNLSRISHEFDYGLRELLFSFKNDVPYTDSIKNYGLSFWHMLCDDDYDFYEDYNKVNKFCTVEYRCPNGTFDEVIWQNYINFFIKLINYCKSDKFDDKLLEKRKIEVIDKFDDLCAYSKIYLEQAIELCDMIFDNNLDKIYFLRQYLKSFELSDKIFAKAKKFTVTKR